MKTTVRLLLSRFLVACSVTPVSPQSFQGGLRGAVRDVDGVIPGADVTLTNEDTNIASRSTTNAAGEYAFPSVLPGTYTVAASAPGFRPFESSGIRIGTQTFITLDITLEVGGVAQTVVVTGQAPLIDKTNASVASMLDRSTLERLPTAGRNPFFLAVTTPNVMPVGDPQFVRQQDQDNSSRLSIGGGPVRANNYLLDGVPDHRPAQPGGHHSVDRGDRGSQGPGRHLRRRDGQDRRRCLQHDSQVWRESVARQHAGPEQAGMGTRESVLCGAGGTAKTRQLLLAVWRVAWRTHREGPHILLGEHGRVPDEHSAQRGTDFSDRAGTHGRFLTDVRRAGPAGGHFRSPHYASGSRQPQPVRAHAVSQQRHPCRSNRPGGAKPHDVPAAPRHR